MQILTVWCLTKDSIRTLNSLGFSQALVLGFVLLHKPWACLDFSFKSSISVFLTKVHVLRIFRNFSGVQRKIYYSSVWFNFFMRMENSWLELQMPEDKHPAEHSSLCCIFCRWSFTASTFCFQCVVGPGDVDVYACGSGCHAAFVEIHSTFTKGCGKQNPSASHGSRRCCTLRLE